jgi:hypothetical protein
MAETTNMQVVKAAQSTSHCIWNGALCLSPSAQYGRTPTSERGRMPLDMLAGDRISVPERPQKCTKNLTVYFFSIIRELSRETASAARLLARIARRAVSRAPSTFGGSAASMCRQVLTLMTTPQRDSFSSFAIDSVIRPSVVPLRKERDSGRSPGCIDEF